MVVGTEWRLEEEKNTLLFASRQNQLGLFAVYKPTLRIWAGEVTPLVTCGHESHESLFGFLFTSQ